MNQLTNMRKIIICGSYSEYRDYLVFANTHQRAAMYVHQPEQFDYFNPESDEIELIGSYTDNLAYQSRQYWAFLGYNLPQSAAG